MEIKTQKYGIARECFDNLNVHNKNSDHIKKW